MKRMFSILLIALMLWGCSADPQPAAIPTEATAPAAETAAPTPVGFYDSESTLEAATNGALLVYPLYRPDGAQIVPMGDGLLLFSGEDATTLTLLAGDDLYVKAAANLNCLIQADDPAVQVSDKGVTYYDEATRELVFLDVQLKEGTRMAMPADMVGAPALSSNRKNLYYCTETALRTIELDSGLDILLREMPSTQHRITALHCSDMILACQITDDRGGERSLFVSAENGRTLHETDHVLDLATQGSRYFARHVDGTYPEYLTGTIQSAVSQLYYDSFRTRACPVLDAEGVLLCSESRQGGTLLEFCDLSSGRRTSLLDAGQVIEPLSVTADEDSLLMLCYDESYGCSVIYRWNLTRSTVADDRSYVGPRYTVDNPDQDALAQCRTLADQIGQRHGIAIRLWTDATAETSQDLVLTPEHQAPVILQWLEELDQLLDTYPAGLLQQLTDHSGAPLDISLIRSFEAADPGEDLSCLLHLDAAADPHLFVTLDENWQTDLHHQLFHVMETHVLTTSPTYDSWSTLNPKNFHYTLQYLEEATDALQGMLESGAFVNLYATSFPKEDRAMTMLAALEPGNEVFFESRVMQSKLKLLCSGIRTAFGYKKSPEVFLWEQYLN